MRVGKGREFGLVGLVGWVGWLVGGEGRGEEGREGEVCVCMYVCVCDVRFGGLGAKGRGRGGAERRDVDGEGVSGRGGGNGTEKRDGTERNGNDFFFLSLFFFPHQFFSFPNIFSPFLRPEQSLPPFFLLVQSHPRHKIPLIRPFFPDALGEFSFRQEGWEMELRKEG